VGRVSQLLRTVDCASNLSLAISIEMGHQIVVSPDSPFTIDNIPFGVIKTAKDSTPRCASAIGDYAIDLSLHAQRGNFDDIEENLDLVDIFSQVRPSTRGAPIAVDPRDLPQLV
jgi:hypothetical protein